MLPERTPPLALRGEEASKEGGHHIGTKTTKEKKHELANPALEGIDQANRRMTKHTTPDKRTTWIWEVDFG
jgi:hypothetical protein